jgi:hypothetical protein
LARKLPNGIHLSEFKDPDPINELRFPTVLAAKRAISTFLGVPLATLSEADLALSGPTGACKQKPTVLKISRWSNMVFRGGIWFDFWNHSACKTGRFFEVVLIHLNA